MVSGGVIRGERPGWRNDKTVNAKVGGGKAYLLKRMWGGYVQESTRGENPVDFESKNGVGAGGKWQKCKFGKTRSFDSEKCFMPK